jgi:uncharacterized protein YkwD
MNARGHAIGACRAMPFVRTARAVLLLMLSAPGQTAFAGLPSLLPSLPEHYLEDRLLTLTNDARSAAGLTPLSRSAVLAQAARQHAEEMLRLGYFGHVSPTPGRRTLEDRVRLVGGTHAAAGENLANVSIRDLDVASRIIDGWFASPGHRANLLEPAWTHVGFGLSEDRNGHAYVVQVFASDPNPLVFANASWTAERTMAVRFEVAVTMTGLVRIATNEFSGTPVAAQAGSMQVLVIDSISAEAPTHIRLGWSPGSSAGFIGQESGWFDPATGRWTEDWTNDQAHASVLRYAWTDPVQSLSLHLAFERDTRDIMLAVDGAQVTAEATGTHLIARLPGREGVHAVMIGTTEHDGRVRVLHRFGVIVRGREVTLR